MLPTDGGLGFVEMARNGPLRGRPRPTRDLLPCGMARTATGG